LLGEERRPVLRWVALAQRYWPFGGEKIFTVRRQVTCGAVPVEYYKMLYFTWHSEASTKSTFWPALGLSLLVCGFFRVGKWQRERGVWLFVET
jgi:hypothetical protein